MKGPRPLSLCPPEKGGGVRCATCRQRDSVGTSPRCSQQRAGVCGPLDAPLATEEAIARCSAPPRRPWRARGPPPAMDTVVPRGYHRSAGLQPHADEAGGKRARASPAVAPRGMPPRPGAVALAPLLKARIGAASSLADSVSLRKATHRRIWMPRRPSYHGIYHGKVGGSNNGLVESV
jgi:hypothetical protein